MPSVRLGLLSLLLCTTWLGCSDDPEPTPDGGASVDAGSNPTDSGSDSGTAPADGGADAGPSEEDGGTDAGPTDNSVRVRSITRHLTSNGFVERPDDFTQDPVELLVPEGDTLVPVSGMAGGPGEYVFPDVPRGTYYLRRGLRYVVTDARNVDLGIDQLGRPDAGVLASAEGHLADLALDGLEPWSGSSSDLQVISAEMAFATFLPTEALARGDVSVTAQGVSISNSEGPMPVFEQSLGDRAWVVQRASRDLGTLPDGGVQRYRTAVRATQLAPFSYDGTAPMPIQGTLQALTLNEFPLDFRVSEFASLAAEVHPAAVPWSNSFALAPAAYGLPEARVGDTGELLRISRPLREASDAVGTLVYGNPFPSSWGVVGTASASVTVDFELPDGLPRRIVGGFIRSDRASTLASSPLAPRTRPPRNLTLDGEEAYTGRTVAAGTHVLAWQPPATGVPDAYVVSFRRHYTLVSPTQTSWGTETTHVIFLDGSATSVRLPAAILQPGELYDISVRAYRVDGYEVSNRPFTLFERIVFDSASTMSGLITVPAPAP